MRKIASRLCRLGYVPELLLSSPLIRATQTANILLRAYGKKVALKIVPSLAPGGKREDLYREMARHAKKLNSLMLVGHQPSLGEIAGEIAWGSPDHWIDLKKGGVCAIEMEVVSGVPKGSLVSLLTPSILVKIGT